MSHNHSHGSSTKAAGFSILSNTLLIIGKVLVGLITGSVSIISEGIHSGIDLVAAIIAYFSVRESGKEADEKHHFGHGKIENVSGTIEGILIIFAAFYIIYEAVEKLRFGGEVEQLSWGMLVMAVSSIVNWFVSSYLMKTAIKTDSIALEADAMHLRTDVYTSLGVFVGLVIIKLTGLLWLDPVVAIIVALMIIKAGIDLTREAFSPLLDASLPKEEEDQIRKAIEVHYNQYVEYHKIRTRKAGPQRYIDLHLVVPEDLTVRAAHDLCDLIELEIKKIFPSIHILIHAEPCEFERCGNCKQHSNKCSHKK